MIQINDWLPVTGYREFWLHNSSETDQTEQSESLKMDCMCEIGTEQSEMRKIHCAFFFLTSGILMRFLAKKKKEQELRQAGHYTPVASNKM